MAVTLPQINLGGGSLGKSPSIRQHQISPPTTRSASQPPAKLTTAVGRKRYQGKKERDLELRQLSLREQLADMTKRETTYYRNSYKHNLCLDMLQEGFHKSFAELFSLIKQQNEARLTAGPESVVWSQTLLENEPEKLDILRKYLTQAETALRKEKYNDIYKYQYELARYFQGTGDKWLADHFFASCLSTAAGSKTDEGKSAAEGHCNVGLAQEENEDYFEAAENFEYFYKLAKSRPDWETRDGEIMLVVACNHLSRIYTTIADRLETEEQLEQYLAHLQKSYDMAKEGGDKRLSGEASYRLGVAYEKNGESETALVYLNGYLEKCRSLRDDPGVGTACQAIAKSYESQGKIEESLKYLEMFVEVAEKTSIEKDICKACSDLGFMFNSLGRYDQAVQYFNKAYNIARSMNQPQVISNSRVLFGVASAHRMLQNFSGHVKLACPPCMERIMEWKDNRGDEFDMPIPEPTEEKKEEKVEAESEVSRQQSSEPPAESEEQQVETGSREGSDATESQKETED